MTAKSASESKLTELMTNHVLSNVNRDKFVTVMDCNSVPHEIGGNH